MTEQEYLDKLLFDVAQIWEQGVAHQKIIDEIKALGPNKFLTATTIPEYMRLLHHRGKLIWEFHRLSRLYIHMSDAHQNGKNLSLEKLQYEDDTPEFYSEPENWGQPLQSD